MQRSTSTSNLVQNVTSSDGGTEHVYEFTAEQAEALAALRRTFTPEQLAEAKLRQRRMQALIEQLAATETLDEQEQLANQLCPRFDKWVHGRNRRPVVVVRTPATTAAPRQRREQRTSRSSGQSPPDDPDPDEPWALTWFDRAPFLWRFRHVRCRLHELREGMQR